LAAKSPRRRHLAGSIAAIQRHNGRDDSRLVPLRAELTATGLEEHIRRVVDAAPPLTAAQREKLVLLLCQGAGDAS
jgi:hypothetical protein